MARFVARACCWLCCGGCTNCELLLACCLLAVQHTSTGSSPCCCCSSAAAAAAAAASCPACSSRLLCRPAHAVPTAYGPPQGQQCYCCAVPLLTSTQACRCHPCCPTAQLPAPTSVEAAWDTTRMRRAATRAAAGLAAKPCSRRPDGAWSESKVRGRQQQLQLTVQRAGAVAPTRPAAALRRRGGGRLRAAWRRRSRALPPLGHKQGRRPRRGADGAALRLLPPSSPSPPSGSGRGPQRQQPSVRAAGRGQGRVRGCARAASIDPSHPPAPTNTHGCLHLELPDCRSPNSHQTKGPGGPLAGLASPPSSATLAGSGQAPMCSKRLTCALASQLLQAGAWGAREGARRRACGGRRPCRPAQALSGSQRRDPGRALCDGRIAGLPSRQPRSRRKSVSPPSEGPG